MEKDIVAQIYILIAGLPCVKYWGSYPRGICRLLCTLAAKAIWKKLVLQMHLSNPSHLSRSLC